jgi:hypothetical protein
MYVGSPCVTDGPQCHQALIHCLARGYLASCGAGHHGLLTNDLAGDQAANWVRSVTSSKDARDPDAFVDESPKPGDAASLRSGLPV